MRLDRATANIVANPELDRKGRRVVLHNLTDANLDVWMTDVVRGVSTRFTSDPEAEESVRVSPGGGSQVRWHPSSRELFYLAPDERLMAVPVNASADGRSVNEPFSQVRSKWM